MRKGNAMFFSALLLTGGNLALQLVAVGFQVYLSGVVGAAGIGLIQLILSVNGLFFAVGSAGNRTCTTYLTARELGRRRPGGVRAALSGCFQYSLAWCLPAAFCLWRLAPWLGREWIGSTLAVPALRLCALLLPMRCLRGVLTGYLTSAGRIRDMVAVNFAEQLCVMVCTYLLLSRWAGGEGGRMCLAVVAGSGAGSLVSFCGLLVLCFLSLPPGGRDCPVPYRQVLKTALPLVLADGLRSSLNTIENLITPKRLALYAGTADALADYGLVCGMVFPVLMFPSAILLSLGELLTPELSRCAARGSRNRVEYLVRRSLHVALLFGLAAGGVLYSTAGALGELLYRSGEVGGYLRLYAIFVPMLYTDIVVDAMCKGLGQHGANARYNTLTSFLDVAGLWVLLPRLGLDGYYFSFAFSHIVNFSLSLRRLMKASGIRPSPGRAVRAILCGLFACAVTALLPQGEGLGGVLWSGSAYLLVLGLSWTLLRVTGREDAAWLRGLAGSRQ